MAPPFRPTQSSGGGGSDNPPSNNLWVGNLPPDVSESNLKAMFENYGKVDSFTMYPSRSYAFVHFKDIEAAKSAKQSLQGHVHGGSTLRVEFTKPAKPCKTLWVAGISQSVPKEELEKEFLRFGKIQEFRFLKDRSTAYVDYVRLEDATQALKSMNGKRIGGNPIRVDFLRSQPSKREQGPDTKEGQFFSRNMGPSDLVAQDSLNHYLEPSLAGIKRPHPFLSAQPSRVLLITHPPLAIVEEDMLHNAMILFGEIERIKTIPDRNCAFVEFRSVEEARRAKEGLQGKLFNDPKISIEFSNCEFPGMIGHVGEFPIQPVQMDLRGFNRPVLPGNNLLLPPALNIRPPLGHHSTFEHAFQAPEFSPQTLMGGPNWRRSSPSPGIGSPPLAGFNVPNRPVPGPWDVIDSSQLQREPKRSRLEDSLPLERTENQGRFDEHGLHSLSSGGASGSLTRVTAGGLGQRNSESDCIWRGLIAKGGNPVCRARCVPIGEGIGTRIPDVVNCSARTGLDMLSKHYKDAIGFNIVFFLPDSEDDFPSYTEFLTYLGPKNRAGVAKFDDGTTLFLVPPSDFLTNVLKVSGPARLYGVVLKFPQAVPSMNPRSSLPSHVDPYKMTDPSKMTSMPAGYSAMHQEERLLTSDNSMVLPDESKLHPKTSGPLNTHSIQPTAAASQAGLALTPELIATLSSLLPGNIGSSGSQTVSLPRSASTLGPTSNVAAGRETSVVHWQHDYHSSDHNGQLVQQLGNHTNFQSQYVPQSQAQAQAPPIVSYTTSHFHQPVNPYSQMHERPTNLPLQWPVSSLQSGPIREAPEMNQQYQPEMNQQYQPEMNQQYQPEMNQPYQQGNSHEMGQGLDHGTDTLRFYNSSIVQQPAYPAPVLNQVHGNGVSQPQPYIPQPSELQPTHQTEQLQTASYGVIQENPEAEAEKNERYKTTLLFAANLLSRIHQPPGNQPGQGAGSR